ncbi:MAG: MerR family transcriptional regulator [Paludibacteraceae bacterium]|nr:MerR family transcriptional regulator [Paludibacteraceae bacterium]
MLNTPQKQYYSIREVSEMLDVSLPTLRYWEQEITQLQPKTNGHQTRFYSAEDIELIRRIKYLRQEQHLSVRAIKKQLDTDRQGVDRRQRIADYLKKIKAELVDIRAMM